MKVERKKMRKKRRARKIKMEMHEDEGGGEGEDEGEGEDTDEDEYGFYTSKGQSRTDICCAWPSTTAAFLLLSAAANRPSSRRPEKNQWRDVVKKELFSVFQKQMARRPELGCVFSVAVSSI
jgi:hypothetical protein